MTIRIIGGGLAGCEAAAQLARRGHDVTLIEQKPLKRTPAQVTDHLAELVCSNSLRSNNVENAVGLIKEEMRRLDGFIVACADAAKVPAGDALAVDRVQFSQKVEAGLLALGVKRVALEWQSIPDDDVTTIIATGPLTEGPLAAELARACGRERLAFYDAIAPIVEADSVHVDPTHKDGGFFLSRYGKGDGTDYLNCPLDKAQYDAFIDALLAADAVAQKDFEKDAHYFEGCLPLEEMAQRGHETLRYGPMKPVGLDHPATQRYPHAVLQLRKEDVHGTAYNLVGCQTRMRQADQRAVFSLIPALKDAVFLRYGAIHRNTYVDAPQVLDVRGALHHHPTVFLAGQITGVEGYVESTASGLVQALVVDAIKRGLDAQTAVPPATTALGGLWRHTRGELMADARQAYQPSNITWAMLPPVERIDPHRKKDDKAQKRKALVERALTDLEPFRVGHVATR